MGAFVTILVAVLSPARTIHENVHNMSSDSIDEWNMTSNVTS